MLREADGADIPQRGLDDGDRMLHAQASRSATAQWDMQYGMLMAAVGLLRRRPPPGNRW